MVLRGAHGPSCSQVTARSSTWTTTLGSTQTTHAQKAWVVSERFISRSFNSHLDLILGPTNCHTSHTRHALFHLFSPAGEHSDPAMPVRSSAERERQSSGESARSDNQGTAQRLPYVHSPPVRMLFTLSCIAALWRHGRHCVTRTLSESCLCVFKAAAMVNESKKSSPTTSRLSDGGEDTKQRVLDALRQPENACCADCNAPSPKCVLPPVVKRRGSGVLYCGDRLNGALIMCGCCCCASRWASVTHGCFICTQCAGVHRSLGVHVSFVLSCTLDKWTVRPCH